MLVESGFPRARPVFGLSPPRDRDQEWSLPTGLLQIPCEFVTIAMRQSDIQDRQVRFERRGDRERVLGIEVAVRTS